MKNYNNDIENPLNKKHFIQCCTLTKHDHLQATWPYLLHTTHDMSIREFSQNYHTQSYMHWRSGAQHDTLCDGDNFIF